MLSPCRRSGVQLTRVEAGLSLGEVPDHEDVHPAPGLVEEPEPLPIFRHDLGVNGEQGVLPGLAPAPSEAVLALVAHHAGQQCALAHHPGHNLATESGENVENSD